MRKIILACAVLLCVSCSEQNSTQTNGQLNALIEQSKGEIDYENSEIEATLLTNGLCQQATTSIAYLLLKNDSVIVIAPKNARPPFTIDEARLLIKSKLRGEMLLID